LPIVRIFAPHEGQKSCSHLHMKFATTLAQNIKTRRKKSGLNQRDFAKKAGVSKSTIDRLENAAQNTTITTLETLCETFKCEIQDLFSPKRASSMEFALLTRFLI